MLREGIEVVGVRIELISIGSHPEATEAAPGGGEVDVVYAGLLFGGCLQQTVDGWSAFYPSGEKLRGGFLGGAGDVLGVDDWFSGFS